MSISGSIRNFVQPIHYCQLYLILLSDTYERSNIRLPAGKATMMFTNKFSINTQSGMAIYPIKPQYKPFACIISGYREIFLIKKWFVMFNGKTLHSCLTGDLNTCPVTFRRVFEIPSSTQQKHRPATSLQSGRQ